MDRQAIIGLVLIFLVVILFSWLNRPSEEELARLQQQRDSVAQVTRLQDSVAALAHAANVQGAEEQALVGEEGGWLQRVSPFDWTHTAAVHADSVQDSVSGMAESTRLGAFPVETSALEEEWNLENDRLQLSFSALGGSVKQAYVKGYTRYEGDSLLLFSALPHECFSFRFWLPTRLAETKDFYFSSVASCYQEKALEPGDTARLVFELPTPKLGTTIRYTYALAYGSYELQFRVDFVGMDRCMASGRQYIDLEWNMTSPQQEKGVQKEREYTRLSYYLYSGDYKELSRKNKPKESEIKDRVEWVAYKQQFFSMIVHSDTPFSQSTLTTKPSNRPYHVADFASTFMLPFAGGASDSYSFQIYLGPNHYKTLKSLGKHYERVVPLGGWLVGWVNKYVIINVFDWLEAHIRSYGLIIFILTILIKLLIFPLTFRSYTSQAKIRVLKPLVDQVNAKYPNESDALKKQQAMMDIYKRAGVNPMGGCLPMLIQFPILVAMFRFFPASIELRQEPFLWADDLSSYDSILDLPFTIPFYGDHVSLFTLLMVLALFFTTRMSMKQSPDTGVQMKGMRFMMQYMMPIMMLLWFNNYSSALSYYYFLASLITILQTFLIRKAIDEEKLFAKLQQKSATFKEKKKGKGKGTFMSRLMQYEEERKRLQAENDRRRKARGGRSHR